MASLISTVGIKFDSGGAPQKLKVLQGGAKKLEQAFDRLAGKTSNASKKAGLFGKAAIGAGAGAKIGALGVKAFGTAVKTAMGPIGLALSAVAGLGAAFNTMKEIEFASAKFRTLGGDSDVLSSKLKLVAIELNGAASVAELTGAAYDVASAGFTDAADAAMILKAASLGATGGFTDINTSGGAAVKVLNAYGLEAKDAAALMDKFAQTQADGIITIGQYSQNIGKVATTAAGLGVSLDEVNAVLAQSTAAGTNIETAFSGLNSALAKISSGQAGKKLGIDLNEATLKTEGLQGALAKLEGFSTGELQEAFGIEAFKGIQVAIQDTEKLNKLIANQADSQGAAQDAAIIAANTIQGAFKRVTNSFSNLFAEQSELGAAIRITLQGVSVVIDGLGIAIKTLMLPVRLLFKLFAGIGSVFEEQFGKGNSAIVLLTKSWTFFLEKVQKGFQLVEAVATAIGTAIGSIALAFDPLFKVIPEIITDAQKRFMRFVTDVKDIFTGLAEIIANVFRRVFKFIGDGINMIMDNIPPALKRFLVGTGEKISSVASNVAKPFQEGFSDVMGDLKGFNKDEEGNERFIDMAKFQEAIAKAGGDINKAYKEYLGTVQEVNNEIKKGKKDTEDTTPAVNKLKEAFEGVKETIAGGLHGAVMGLIDGTKSLGESLAGIAKQIASLMLKKAIFGAFGLKAAEGAYVSNGIRPFAAGGMVTKPTMGLVGEAGEDEYIIPASKMAQSMQRYSAGARGESVIPGTGQSSAGGGADAQTTVNYSGPILNFNSEEFVPKSAIGQIINSAASRGAKAGEARTLSSLQNSRSKRQGIGL